MISGALEFSDIRINIYQHIFLINNIYTNITVIIFTNIDYFTNLHGYFLHSIKI